MFTRTPPAKRFRVLRLALPTLVVAALASHSARAASNLQFLPSIEAFFFHDGNVAVTGSNPTSDQVGRLQANLDLQSRSPTTRWNFGYSIYRENFKDLSELDNTGMWLATRYRKDTSRRNNYDLSFFAVRTERQRIRQETIEDPDNLVERTELDRLRFVARGRVESGKRSFVRWTGAARINRYDRDGLINSDAVDLGVGWGYEVSRKADLGVVYGYTHIEFDDSGAPRMDSMGLPVPPPPTTNTHLLDLAFDYELGPKARMRAFVGIQSYDEDGGNSDTVPSFDFRVRREVTRGSDLIFGVRQGISSGTGQGGATQDYGGYVSWNYRPGRNYRISADATYWHRENVSSGVQEGSGNQGFRTLSRIEWTPGHHIALGVFHSYVDQNSLTSSPGSGTNYNTGGINVRWDIKGRSGRRGSLGR